VVGGLEVALEAASALNPCHSYSNVGEQIDPLMLSKFSDI